MAENRVVIKINIDKQRQANSVPSTPATVTVWHVRRILLALAILVMLIIMLLMIWPDKNDNNITETSVNSVSGENSSAGIKDVTENSVKQLTESIQNPLNSTGKSNSASNWKLLKSSAIILDKNVIRASLNTELLDNEPVTQLKLPISLTKLQKLELYYFNQLRDIKNKKLFHYWWKNDKLILKKSLAINTGSTKVISSKFMNFNDNGDWKIQLRDINNKVYCEVEFIIVTE